MKGVADSAAVGPPEQQALAAVEPALALPQPARSSNSTDPAHLLEKMRALRSEVEAAQAELCTVRRDAATVSVSRD